MTTEEQVALIRERHARHEYRDTGAEKAIVQLLSRIDTLEHYIRCEMDQDVDTLLRRVRERDSERPLEQLEAERCAHGTTPSSACRMCDPAYDFVSNR